MLEYWQEVRTGKVQSLERWRYEWEDAQARGLLADRGWADTWKRQLKTVLVSTHRKRKPGGGRKVSTERMKRLQLCLPKEQSEAIRAVAEAAGISQSAWIREAIDARLASCERADE